MHTLKPSLFNGCRAVLAALLTVFLTAACGLATSMNRINTTMQDAVDSFDRAIAALSQQSADWRIVVQDLEKNLTADMQSTVRTEVTNLTQTAIATAGAELRCNAEFMRVSLERELTKLRNNLVRALERDARILPEKPALPFICSAVPPAVDLSLSPDRRMKIDVFGFDLRSQPLTVSLMSNGAMSPRAPLDPATFRKGIEEFRKLKAAPGAAGRVAGVERIDTALFTLERPEQRVKTDVSGAFSVVSDFQAVLDLTESGFQLLPNAQSIVLSCGSKVLSEIAILTHQQVLTCESVTKDVAASKQTFIPPAVEANLYGRTPDKEFDGHGPCISFNLSLRVNEARREIWAEYSMDAWESTGDCTTIHSDYTEASGSGSILLFTAAENEKILGFDADASMSDSVYQSGGDTSVSPIRRYFAGTKPVTELQYVGDTDGNEAGSKTGVTMFFRPFRVRLERCEWK